MSLFNRTPRAKKAVSFATRRVTPRFVGMLDTLEDRKLFADVHASLQPVGDPGDPGTPGGVEADQYEPNNTIAEATDLPLGAYPLGDSTIHGTSAANQRDVDYFRIYAPSNGLITIDEIGATISGTSLNLNIYNSAGTLITASTAGSGTARTATINATAGQSYYAKVNGANSLGYAIQANYVSANFVWAMPNTFGGAGGVDNYGLPTIPNTPGYARPNEQTIGGRSVSLFPVRFTRAGSAGSGATYAWHVIGNASDGNNAAYGIDFAGADATVNLPNGKYDVTLTVTSNGVSVTSTQSIVVRNYLLVAIGDSYSSGEGNPHADQTYNWPWDTRKDYAVWAQGGDDVQTLWNRMSHRSTKAGVAQAALAIENADPHTSVTFVFLSESGATIHDGILGSKGTAEKDAPGTLPSQLDQLRGITGQRPIDALTLSIGGNDIGFGDIFGGLVKADPFFSGSNYNSELESVFSAAEEKLTHLTAYYAELNAGLKQFDIGQVFMTEYPDLTKNGEGQYVDILGDIGFGHAASASELQTAVNRLMVPFVTTMHVAAAKFGWTWVGGISDQFANGHHGGYGTILRSASDSIRQQGPLDQGAQGADPYVIGDTKGMMHPIGVGLDIQKNAILDAWQRPELVIDNWTIGADALLANATSGYSFSVRNASFLATSGANYAAIYAAPTANLSTTSGVKLTDMIVHTLSPGESQSFSGTLPPTADPFHSTNALYVGAIADEYNDIPNEANEVNTNPVNPTRFISDRDTGIDGNAFFLNMPTIHTGTPVYGAIGIDELAGGYDIDSYRFTSYAGQRVQFNVNSSDNLDTYLKIYRVVGNQYFSDYWSGTSALVASNDDGAAPGEAPSTQSFLDYTFNGGDYAIQICQKVNGLANGDQLNLTGRQLGATGHYSILATTITDATPPHVVGKGYDWNTNRAWFQFDEAINPSIAASVLKLADRTHGNAAITGAATGVTYDAATKTVWFALKNTGLADADYRVTLPAGTFADSAGNVGAADASADFFILAGDVNHDRTVNFDDMVILAQNYNKAGRTFAQGNLDRSAEGNVNFDDLIILAQQYNKKLGVAPAVTATLAGAKNKPSCIALVIN